MGVIGAFVLLWIVGIGLILGLFVAFPFWALKDVIERPSWAFDAADTSRVTWIAAISACALVGLGWVPAALWMSAKRPAVRHAQTLGPSAFAAHVGRSPMTDSAFAPRDAWQSGPVKSGDLGQPLPPYSPDRS